MVSEDIWKVDRTDNAWTPKLTKKETKQYSLSNFQIDHIYDGPISQAC